MKRLFKYLTLLAVVFTSFAGATTVVFAEETRLVDPEAEVTDTTFFVDASWVNDQLEDPNTLIIHAGYSDENYKKEHIPGSIFFNTNEIETLENDWNIVEPEEVERLFLEDGITNDKQLIVVAEDINEAARVAFAAYWLGVKTVKILDGGYEAWVAEDLPTTADEPEVEAATAFGIEVPGRPEVLIKTSEDLLKAEEEMPDLVLASTRSWEEFTGKESGYAYIEDTGEPEGAVYMKVSESSSDVNFITDDTFHIIDPRPELYEEWAQWGITEDVPVAMYCGTGWRNSTVFFTLLQAGWKPENLMLFDGGWYEWDLRYQEEPERFPIQKGDPNDTDNFKVLDGSEEE